MNRRYKIIVLIIILIIILFGIYFFIQPTSSGIIGENDVGYVEKEVYNYYNSNTTIVLITGIHPRETLAIEPEIKAAQEFARSKHINIINYNVVVTDHPDEYIQSRANGESLVHDYVLCDINKTDAKAVIISHSHIEGYGEGFYVATPAMDNASVEIAQTIANESDFNYYPRTGNEEYKSTSAVLVSCPIANAGYPTFVYEIPENITEDDSTQKTIELFGMIYDIVSI